MEDDPACLPSLASQRIDLGEIHLILLLLSLDVDGLAAEYQSFDNVHSRRHKGDWNAL